MAFKKRENVSLLLSVVAIVFTGINLPFTYCNYENSIVNIQVQWQSLRKDYETVNKQIMDWEETLKLQNDGPQIENQQELKDYLSTKNCPRELANLYLARLDRYDSLRNAAAHYSPFKTRLSGIDLRLPILPRLLKFTAKIEGTSSVPDIKIDLK
jgi:hypothetical protein